MALVAHYRLDGDVNDAFGRNNGIASGALVFEDGKLGKCINLKTSGNVTFPTSIKHTYSVSFWYKRVSSPDGSHRKIFTKGADRSPGFWTGPTDFLHLRQSLVNGGNVGADIYEVGTGVWRHIVFTCEQTAAGVRINSYMDGVKSASSGFYAGDSVSITGDPNSFVLNSEPVVGHSLDDIRIYDHALSEREVRDLSLGKLLHYGFDHFQEPTENKASGVTYSSYAPYHSISGDANRVTMVWATTNGYMTIGNFGTLQGNTITVSGYMKKNGVPYLPALDRIDTYQSATTIKHTMDSSTGRFEVTQVYTTSGGWLFHTPVIAAIGDVLTIDDFQVEFNKGYATPFVNGTRPGTVRDQSAQGSDAPLALANTPRWIEAGRIGKGAYEFDGSVKYISLTGLKVVGDRTVAFWAYPRETAVNWRSVIDSESGRYIIGTLSGNFTLYLIDSWRLSVAATLNAWQHIAYVSEGTVTKVYKNGVYAAQFTGTVPPIGGTIKIGSRYPGETAYLNADLDDLRIYTTALTADEVMELYRQRASIDSQGNLIC